MTFDVKKTVVFGAAFGVAAVLASVAMLWISSRPKGWDSNSIKCAKLTVLQTLADVPANPTTGEPEHFEGSGFRVEFVLENHTRNDYTVPQDLKLFTRDDRSSALSELKATFDHPYVIPANERAEVDADVEYSCGVTDMGTGKKTERPEQECFNDEFGHVAGFVGFDFATHTRLDLPRPTFSKGWAAAAAALGK
ncbi:MAG: hypothetical protein ABSE27_13515 [Acidobacteriaceae bacterium]|jgi:hypothetical protein